MNLCMRFSRWLFCCVLPPPAGLSFTGGFLMTLDFVHIPKRGYPETYPEDARSSLVFFLFVMFVLFVCLQIGCYIL